MRHLMVIVAFLFAACTFPPGVFKPDPTPVNVATEEPKQEPKQDEEVKPEVREVDKPRAKLNLPTCKGIDTGNAQESLNLKLDCMLDGK